MRTPPLSILAFLALAAPAILVAGPITIDFEGLPDSTILTNQYPGVTFSNAVILTAGISLDEFEFPPHSGTNVASDNGGPMSITFSTPVQSFGGYFTYAELLTVDAFGIGNTLLASVTPPFANNEALSGVSGSSPNEFLQVSSASGVSRVTITGDLAGGSFALDDATYSTAVSTVPEPSSLSLCILFAGLMALYSLGRQKRRGTAVNPETAPRATLGCRTTVWALMRRTQEFKFAVFAFGVAFLSTPMLGQQHTIGGTGVSPRIAVVGQPSIVTVSASISDPAVIVGGVNLLRLDSLGNATVLGTLHDDGQNGDAVAGDGVFTYQAPLNESAVGQIHFQVSAAFRGSILRVRADVPPVFVQVTNASTVAVTGLASELASGNISSALGSFLDSDKASAILNNLNAAGQQRLANAFAAAQLVSSSGDLRVYHLPWTAPNGNVLTLEVALEPNSNGDWVIVSW
jgi:hypothetical protein